MNECVSKWVREWVSTSKTILFSDNVWLAGVNFTSLRLTHRKWLHTMAFSLLENIKQFMYNVGYAKIACYSG